MRLTLLALMISFLASPVWADQISIGTIKNVKGIAYVQRGHTRILCKPGLQLRENDLIRTLEDTHMGLTLSDETSFALGPDTLIILDQYAFNSNTYDGHLEASFEEGTLAIQTGRLARSSRPQIRVKTNQSVLGVRGTFFLIES